MRCLSGHGSNCPDTEIPEDNMPILLWALGVPIGLIVVLMLFGAV
jgi:hypothetical protein